MDLLLFFFFQAEGGIRDGTVTGVQTCALPISLRVGEQNGQLQAGLAVLGQSLATDRGGSAESLLLDERVGQVSENGFQAIVHRPRPQPVEEVWIDASLARQIGE